MGFLGDVIGSFTGATGATAAKRVAGIQAAGAEEARTEVELARERALEGITPFAEVGRTDLLDLGQLVTDPERQKRFIEDNPFFEALAERAQTGLFQTQAAKGKLGSGETAEELQSRLLTIGSDLLARDISQRQSLASLGLQAGTTAAGIETGTARTVSDLITGKAAAGAAGIRGAAEARAGGVEQTFKTIGALTGIGL